MRNKLDTLLKIEKNVLDNYIKEVNSLKEKKQKFENEKLNIQKEYQTNFSNNDYDDLGLFFAGYYSDLLKNRIAEKDKNITALAKEIEIQQDAIKEKFSDIKRIELIIKQKQFAHKKRLEKKEQDFLNEIKVEKI